MRKTLVLTCIVLLLIPAVVLAGCGGGDTAQAKKYVEQGEQLAEERGSKNTELLEEWEAVREATDPAAKAAVSEQAEKTYGEALALVQDEKAEYEKIKGLEGVDEYAEYADLKIQELNAYEQLLTATNEFLQKVNNEGFASKQELDAANQAYQAEAEKLQEENERAGEEAARLKKDKDL